MKIIELSWIFQLKINENEISSKERYDELTQTMLEKANKASVANALHRKSNKTDHQDARKEFKTKITDVTGKLDKML